MPKYAFSALYCLGLFLIITSSLKTESDLPLNKGEGKRELVEEVQNNTQTAKSRGLLTRGLQGVASGLLDYSTAETTANHDDDMMASAFMHEHHGEQEEFFENHEETPFEDEFEDYDDSDRQCFMREEPSEVELWCRFKNEECSGIVTLAWQHSDSPQTNATEWCKNNGQCSNLVQYYHALDVGTGFDKEVDTWCKAIGELPEAASWCTKDIECSSIVNLAWQKSDDNKKKNATEWCKDDDQCDCLVKDYYELNNRSGSDEKVVIEKTKKHINKTTHATKRATKNTEQSSKKDKSRWNDI